MSRPLTVALAFAFVALVAFTLRLSPLLPGEAADDQHDKGSEHRSHAHAPLETKRAILFRAVGRDAPLHEGDDVGG